MGTYSMKTNLVFVILTALILLGPGLSSANASSENEKSENKGVPILLYHRFGARITGDMMVTTGYFESQLKFFRENGHTVIPLRQLVDFYLGKGPPIPAKAVVITADDGHKSVYTDMFPLIKKYNIPVTLFLYPSALSNASYAMTWDQLREMKKTGLVDFQSHTYWHPNFKREKKKLDAAAYDKLVETQLKKSREKLQKELQVNVDMLAWPFGIFDPWLMNKAAEAGYKAAFTMERRDAIASDNIMALPRYLVVEPSRRKGA